MDNLRYQSIRLEPVFEITEVPQAERVFKTCPKCDYPIAWDKQSAGILINCCWCFHLHDGNYEESRAIAEEIRQYKIAPEKLDLALEYCRAKDGIHYADWESMPNAALKILLSKIKG